MTPQNEVPDKIRCPGCGDIILAYHDADAELETHAGNCEPCLDRADLKTLADRALKRKRRQEANQERAPEKDRKSSGRRAGNG